MGHTLFPAVEGHYLQPDEIVRRLQAEFKYVEADIEAGTAHVQEMLGQFERMTPAMVEMYKSVNLDVPTHILSLRGMLGKAVAIVVSDRPKFENDYIHFVAMPETAPLIGYKSGDHEDAAAPLLRRICAVLGYDAEVV